MAGRGPSPKLREQRLRSNRPARGEWQTLPTEPYDGPRPAMPRVQGGLIVATKRTWERWWASPMAHMWSEADWSQLERAIILIDQTGRMLYRRHTGGLSSLLAELRQLEDRLGLSEKGRRDLRWKFEDVEPAQLAEVRALPSRQRTDPRKL